ncbi:MAG: hypothetical protein WCJ46_05985 [bacterium]
MEPKTLLLIGNTPSAIKFIVKSFGKNNEQNSLSVVDDCASAKAFLAKAGKYKDAPRPDAIFVGAHILKTDREEFMKYIKQNPDSRIRCVPVLKLASC